MKVEKIDHLAVMENAVKQIAQRPTQDRRYGHYSQTARLLGMPEEQDQREDRHPSRNQKKGLAKPRRRLGEHTKGRPGVVHASEVEKGVDHRHRLVQTQGASNQRFGHLVEDEDCSHDEAHSARFGVHGTGSSSGRGAPYPYGHRVTIEVDRIHPIPKRLSPSQ